MTQERHWIDNVADLISGRVHNTLVTHNASIVSLSTHVRELLSTVDQLKTGEIMQTENEKKIMEAAQHINENNERLATAFEGLLKKIDELSVPREDLSDELADLNAAIGRQGQIGANLASSTVETPVVNDAPITGGPIVHGEPAVTPLAGGGPTDAGVPTEVPAPGTGVTLSDQPTTPVVEDATNEANPEIPADTGENDQPPVENPDLGPAQPASPVEETQPSVPVSPPETPVPSDEDDEDEDEDDKIVLDEDDLDDEDDD